MAYMDSAIVLISVWFGVKAVLARKNDIRNTINNTAAKAGVHGGAPQHITNGRTTRDKLLQFLQNSA